MMEFRERKGLLRRVGWLLFSVPIYVEIAGIGLGVALLFGGVAYQQIRSELLSSRYAALMEDVVSTARLLSSSLEQPVATEDVAGVDRVIGVVRRTVPDLHYVRIEGAGGAHRNFFMRRGRISKIVHR